ncbi:MAG: AI-2E family transporter [Candidatus Sericytochromatia bacterium]|nr:AI-2E family transporter [Candidatus Sericytochromatia bacterium]
MPSFERSVTVTASVDQAYQWWARVENIASLVPGLKQLTRTGPFTSSWCVEWAPGQEGTWDTSIVQDLPQRLVAWESRSGPWPNRGRVEFEALSSERTRVTLSLEEEPEHPTGDTTPTLYGGIDAALMRFGEAMAVAEQLPAAPEQSGYQALFLKSAAATGGALTTLALAWSLVALIEVWVVVVGALLVAAALGPAVQWLMHSKLHRAGAVGVTFIAVTAAITVLSMLLIPQVMTQGQDLAASLPGYVDRAQEHLTQLHARHRLVPDGSRLMGYVAETGSQVLANAFNMTGKFVWLIIVLLSILFLAFFILLDGRLLQEALVRWIPLKRKDHVPALLHMVEQRVGRFMAGLALICAVAGLLTWGALAWLGLPYALLVGAVTALLQAIPFVGPLIGGALAGLIGLSKSGSLALWTVVVYAAIQQLIGQVLFPWIMGRSIGMHPAWVAVVLLVGGTLYGLTGAFLSIPVAIAVSIILECYYLPWAEAKSGDEVERQESRAL